MITSDFHGEKRYLPPWLQKEHSELRTVETPDHRSHERCHLRVSWPWLPVGELTTREKYAVSV